MQLSQHCQRLVQLAERAGKANQGLRATWPLLARDVLALLAGLRRAVMLDYAAKLDPAALADAVRGMQAAALPKGMQLC